MDLYTLKYLFALSAEGLQEMDTLSAGSEHK